MRIRFIKNLDLKTKEKKEEKHLRIWQLNNNNVFWVSLFTGGESKMDKGGSWEILKVQ